MRDTYTRAVSVLRIIDGDTFVCDVDLGFYVTVRMSCRLAGINTPELRHRGGTAAREALAAALASPVTITSVKADKFAGRFDAIVFSGTTNVNELMISSGHALPWDGNGPKPVIVPSSP